MASCIFDINDLPGRQEKFYSTAYAEAQKSKLSYQTGAVMTYNATPVGAGFNDIGRTRVRKQNVCSVHAELAAMRCVVPGTHQIKWYEKEPKEPKGNQAKGPRGPRVQQGQ